MNKTPLSSFDPFEWNFEKLKAECGSLCEEAFASQTPRKKENDIIQFLNKAPFDVRDVLTNNFVIKNASVTLLKRIPKDVVLETPDKTINHILNLAVANFSPCHTRELFEEFSSTPFFLTADLLIMSNRLQKEKDTLSFCLERMVTSGGIEEFLSVSFITLKSKALEEIKERARTVMCLLSTLLATQDRKEVDRRIENFVKSALKNSKDFEILDGIPPCDLKTRLTRHAIKASLENDKPVRSYPRML